ncbi:hypothetical protein RE6C_05787 [Rhodopirellula europaea 6C]|uniref:Uncharacterized protein n=1 Tax=Rhodopirellula europaea 6C TaxID=1263867 RepID=M2AU93_9BACT|nr:hypothetical protein RE6C_05787 [Rhodopirellula europaea 6C]
MNLDDPFAVNQTPPRPTQHPISASPGMGCCREMTTMTAYRRPF